VISSSTRLSRSSRTTAARTIARSVPKRTSGWSVATRWLASEATYPIASTRLVLPCPLSPTRVVTPGSSASSADGKLRKSPTLRCRTCTSTPRRGPPDSCRGAGTARRSRRAAGALGPGRRSGRGGVSLLRGLGSGGPADLLLLEGLADLRGGHTLRRLGPQVLALGHGHHLVPAELTAQRRDGLHGRADLPPGGEAGEEGGGDDRHGHGVGDPLLDGPATLAGVGGVVADVGEVRVLLERRDHEVEQPRP